MTIALDVTVNKTHLIQAVFAAIDSKNWVDLETLLHPDVVYHRPGYEMMSGRLEVLKYYRYHRSIVEGNHKSLSVIVEANNVTCCGLFEGTLKDQRVVSLEFCDIYRVSDLGIMFRKTFFYVPAV